jgi:hypothetical protein
MEDKMNKEFIQKLIIAFVQNGTLSLPKINIGGGRDANEDQAEKDLFEALTRIGRLEEKMIKEFEEIDFDLERAVQIIRARHSNLS